MQALKVNFALVAFAAAVLVGLAIGSEARAQPSADETFARVGDVVLTQRDFDAALSKAIRSRFYHGSIPEGALPRVRMEVAEDLVNRTLLLAEAERRNLEVDEETIQATLAQYDRRYSDNPRWQERRDSLLSRLAQDLREEQLLTKLESAVRKPAPPTQAQLRTYYDDHPREFTEPARMRVSLILLGVAPSAPSTTWDAAFDEARTLTALLQDGADFAELARVHSTDASAENGGDMGYLHQGMLAESAQTELNKLTPGDFTQPVRVLEGVAILKLTDATEPRLREFVDVRQRVQELWLRRRGEEAWTLLIDQLRDSTTITIYGVPDTASDAADEGQHHSV